MAAGDETTLEAIADSVRGGYRTLEEMVIEAIRTAILSGVFRPGERLPQDRIAEALEVSRIPVRSALRLLESEGLVVFHSHRGATVSVLTPDEVAEIYQIRTVLEKFALRAACEHMTPADLDELSGLVEAMDRARDGAQPEEWLRVRNHFYRRLYEIARVPRTAAMIDRLRGEVGRYLERQRAGDSDGHRVIVDALKSGDPVAAERWLEAHLSRVSKDIQETVRAAHAAGESGSAS